MEGNKKAVTNVTAENKSKNDIKQEIFELFVKEKFTYLEASEILLEMHTELTQIAIRKKMS